MNKQAWECPFCRKSGEVECHMYENLYSVTKKLRNDHARVSPQCTQFDEVVRKYMWLVVGIRLFFAASLGLIALLFYYFLR